MFNRRWTSFFTSITFVISVLINYLFPISGLWMLFLLPLFGLIILFPTWLMGNLTILILVTIRYLILYVAFSGRIPLDFLVRLVTTSTVGWIILLTVTFFIRKINSLVQQLEYLSLTDTLTNTFNRRYLDVYAKEILNDGSLSHDPVSFLLLDIDYFKNINDQYGHNFGDEVLKQLTLIIQTKIRKSDVLIRMGGEEFALILPLTPIEEGFRIAEELRNSIQRSQFKHHGHAIPITISTGITEYTGETLGQLIEKADQALYQAKANGRNTVVRYSYPIKST